MELEHGDNASFTQCCWFDETSWRLLASQRLSRASSALGRMAKKIRMNLKFYLIFGPRGCPRSIFVILKPVFYYAILISFSLGHWTVRYRIHLWSWLCLLSILLQRLWIQIQECVS